MSFLYHGTSHDVNSLEPRPSKVLENEKAVFATDSKDLAVIFIPRWNDCDMDLGYHRGVLYCSEQYPNAFDKLKNVKGYIYTVDKDKFSSDSRLGMKKHEFICKDSVPIIKKEIIDDAYTYLKKSTICMISYDDKLNALWDAGLINESKHNKKQK